ncbi:MAG: TraI/MobA(P) family conjugative relaxase [Candidatus Cloacimonadaceae bacterium]|nr:TraI/MobA(P) family conjugative relaxase [Candidatus Cloacimonadaceae bacterium]
MIVKKIKNPKKSSTKATRIGGLLDYILIPENNNTNEKCVYSGAINFLTDTHKSQKAEILALSQESVRSSDTVNHYVISWQEGEQPSHAQIDEAVNLFLDELGLNDHQTVYGLHADTDNLHLHMVINRVHPESLKVIKPNKGFDIEAAHKAIARIEHVQGWKREQHGRYQVLESGELGREHIDTEKQRQPDQVKRDREQRTGEKSAQRIAIEDGAAIIKSATDWQTLHRQLAEKGIRYEKKGSGAMLYVGEVAIKPSSVDRGASLPHLQMRLGVYESPNTLLNIVERKPEPIQAGQPGWETFITDRKAHYAAKNTTTMGLRKQQEAERQQLVTQQKAKREMILKGSWKGKGDLLNAMRSVLAAEQAAEKAGLKESHQQAWKPLRQQYRPFPDYEQWLRQQQQPEQADVWRYRHTAPQRIQGDTHEPPTPRDIRAYTARITGRQVHYFRKENTGQIAGQGGAASFVDKGREIDIHDWRNRDCVLAALQLSAQKWGGFRISGNPEYKALCIELAAEHGFKINNPELQTGIENERQRLQQARAQEKTVPQPVYELGRGR